MKDTIKTREDEATTIVCTDEEIIQGRTGNINVDITRDEEEKIKETLDGERVEIEGSVTPSEEKKVGTGTSRKWAGTGGDAAIKNPEIKPTTKGRVKISGTRTTPDAQGVFK